jgi:hypothetical protein
MPEIASGFVTALFLFDVAEGIDLGTVRSRLGADASTARLDDKSRSTRLEYVQPPVVVDGAALRCQELDGFRVRVKFYDYGVISLMLSRTYAGSWANLLDLGQQLVESEPLEAHATEACRAIVNQLGSTLKRPRTSYLSEDYLVFAVTSLEAPVPAARVLQEHGRQIAQLLRGDSQPLSGQEQAIVLQSAFSYFDHDVVVPAWNAAFILDNEAAALSAIEIMEFVNSQLLELRYHDEMLERELTQLYAQLQEPRWTSRIASRRHRRAALHVQALVIDVNELADRVGNAIKFVGDIYLARLLNILAQRLGLDNWRRDVRDKLQTLNEIHRFAVEQATSTQNNIMELAIVVILVIELGMIFAGLIE